MKSCLFTYYPLFVDFSHAAALLKAICNKSGLDVGLTRLDDTFSAKIKGYDVISVSFVCDEDYKASLPYMQIAKDAGKEVIAGGVYARRGAKVEIADKVCRGEAEGQIVRYLVDSDKRIFNEVGYSADISSLPLPDISQVKGHEFHRNMPWLQGLKIIPYQTARGCIGKCSFCNCRLQPAGIRIKKTIRKDMCELNRIHRPDLFYLLDELPPYYLKEWRDQWEGSYYSFMSYIRADIKPEYLEWLIAHGLKVTAFGVESGDERYRNRVLKKNVTDMDIYRTVGILNRHNVICTAFYMVDGPGETDRMKKKTEEMTARLGVRSIVHPYQDIAASYGD